MTDASAPATRPMRRSSSDDTTATMTVACDLPNGHILQIYNIEVVEQMLPNGRTFKENNSTLDLSKGQYVLNGSALDYAALGAGGMPDYRVIKGKTPGTGYGLTSGIPRAFWEEWFEQNKRNPLVTGHHIFAAGTEDRAVRQAREQEEIRSGFQGLNPAGDYRVPSGRGVRKYNPNDNRTAPDQPSLVTSEDSE